MKNNQAINEIKQNIFASISALTDAAALLSQNEETKKYLKDYEKLQQEIEKDLNVYESNRQFDIKIAYEQAIGITAFLTGFKLSFDLLNFIQDKNFVAKATDKLYK